MEVNEIFLGSLLFSIPVSQLFFKNRFSLFHPLFLFSNSLPHPHPRLFFFFPFFFFRLLGTFSCFRILLCIIHARKASCAGELLWDVGMSERDGERRGEGEWEEGREGGERRRKAGREMVSEVLALFFVPPWEKLQLSVWLWLRGVMGVAEEGGWRGGEGN